MALTIRSVASKLAALRVLGMALHAFAVLEHERGARSSYSDSFCATSFSLSS
jgi:hypothetical protein